MQVSFARLIRMGMVARIGARWHGSDGLSLRMGSQPAFACYAGRIVPGSPCRMQRLIFIGLIVAMVLGAAVGAFVYGDQGARATAAAERVAAFDANRDGTLSEEEFKASQAAATDGLTFAQADKNKNGQVTALEIEKTPTKSQTDIASYFKILSDISSKSRRRRPRVRRILRAISRSCRTFSCVLSR
jgi:hypothetical protein